MAATSQRPEIIALSQGLRGIPHCEEYERMISGMMYNPNMPKLLDARHRCRGLARAYNNLVTTAIPSTQIFETRLALLRQLVGKVGEGTFIEPFFKPDYGCKVVIGGHSFINWDVTVLDTSLVFIRNRVQVGTGVNIFTASYDTSVLSRQKFVEFGHSGSTIGAGSIVTKDIPPFSVAVGAPCRVRKTIQSPEEEQDSKNPYRDLVREDQ
ncbi:trimeric LpxA-like protein [Aspergillus uvarum CBS 121591]|uniref:Trimeric LpxA-like protein n=1 Tax=Aspergillus uvarum CBS 121591 TaxID=1448315 RepID=A0A319CMN4_9EURO|nr:trimeric LpxA-like protein [Aspergillus uvarum CBS 121591]PYH85840.1 trimeric LpxA-like protein [Aspergillus uvarum CBS 121591]